jgi:hypothetical protein
MLLSGLIGGSKPQQKLEHIKHMVPSATQENFRENIAFPKC